MASELEELIDAVAEKIQEESLKRNPVPKAIDEMEIIDKVIERIPEELEKTEHPIHTWGNYYD